MMFSPETMEAFAMGLGLPIFAGVLGFMVAIGRRILESVLHMKD